MVDKKCDKRGSWEANPEGSSVGAVVLAHCFIVSCDLKEYSYLLTAYLPKI